MKSKAKCIAKTVNYFRIKKFKRFPKFLARLNFFSEQMIYFEGQFISKDLLLLC